MALRHTMFYQRFSQCLLLCASFFLLPLAAQPSTPTAARVHVVMGLPQALLAETESAMRSQLGDVFELNLSVLPTRDADAELDMADALTSITWNDETAIILGVGRQGCEVAARSKLACPVLCVLLSSEAFAMLQEKVVHPDLHAIVVDQPESRQARVATSIYPELKRFVILSEEPDKGEDHPEIEQILYTTGESLAAQVTNALVGRDALIATPEHEIFNRSTLRTVLLTAYGYAKPVIGYSRAYVKAGALISSYSSSMHAFKQVAELLPELLKPEHSEIEETLTPRYFSIADNPSVARSLGLIKRRSFAMDASFSDEDFRS